MYEQGSVRLVRRCRRCASRIVARLSSVVQELPTPHTSAVDLLGICSHGTGSADLDAMFCPQDDPYTCIGTYVIKQEDMDAGGYSTTSRATSVSPNRTIIEDAEGSTVELKGAASISVGERVL